MQELTPEQKKKFEKWNRILKGGPFAILQYIDELEGKIDSMNPDFQKFLDKIKGKDANPEELAVMLKNDPFFLRMTKPKYKEDFSLDDSEIADIAMLAADRMMPSMINFEELATMAAALIEVPVVDKVIEHHHHTNTVERIPMVTNSVVEKAMTDSPEEIRDKVESLPEGERIDIKYIDGVIELLEKTIKKYASKFKGSGSTMGVGGGTGGGRVVRYYDLSGQLNGVLKTFPIPANWRVISVQSSSFPGILRPLIDYTATPQSITFTSEISAASTLAAGQTLIVLYSE